MKRFALLVVVCAGCKSDPKPAAAPPPANDTPLVARAVMRPRVAPALPPDETEGSNRPALPDEEPVRHHHRHGGWGSDWGSDMTPEQRQAARHARIDAMRTRLDSDGDGKLSYDELQNAPGRMHFDNPADIDTNHDGDISTDELEAAMQARMQQWRAQRQAGQGGGSAGAPATGPATAP